MVFREENLVHQALRDMMAETFKWDALAVEREKVLDCVKVINDKQIAQDLVDSKKDDDEEGEGTKKWM